jgi:hypothetical protein
MQGRWAAAKARISSLVTGAVNAGKTIGGVISDVWHSETLRKSTKTFSLQALSGMSVSSFFSFFSVSFKYDKERESFKYEKVHPVLWGSAPNGVASFGGYIPDTLLFSPASIVICEQLLTQALRKIPGVEGSYAEYGLYALDAATYLYLVRRSLNAWVDNALYSAAAGKAATPPVEESGFKPCPKECGETASTMADLMAIFESGADTAFCYSTAYAISNLMFKIDSPLPYVGAMVLYPLLSLKYGRDILNAKLSSVGMCETHRQDILNANNAYCMGKGALFLTGVYGTEFVISYFTGINSSMINAALFNYNYTSFMLAELQIDGRLPGTEIGVNIFNYVHKATQGLVRWTVSKAVALSYDPASTVTWAQQLQNIHDKYHSAPMRLAVSMCFGSDMLSFREFLKRPSIRSYLTVYESTLKDNVEWINGLRRGRIPDFVLKVLPERVLSKTTKDILLKLRSKEMDEPARSMNNLIERIYPGAFPYIHPKDEPTSLVRAETVAKAREDQNEKGQVDVAGPLDRAAQMEKRREEQHVIPSSSTSPGFRLLSGGRSTIRQVPQDRQQISSDARSFLMGKKQQ